MRILVTSASGANGDGYGAILGFGPEGEFTGRSAATRGSPTRAAPAGRGDHGAVGEGELVQVVVVPARERVVDGLAKLLERGGPGGDQDAARPRPQVPGMHAMHQLHRDRQMCPSHTSSARSRPAGGGESRRSAGPAAGWRYHRPPDEGRSEAVFCRFEESEVLRDVCKRPGRCRFVARRGEVGGAVIVTAISKIWPRSTGQVGCPGNFPRVGSDRCSGELTRTQ